MVDLTVEMAQLWAALRPASPAHIAAPQVIQFVAASAGEGTSTVAREFARFAAARAQRPVWLVESDVTAGIQYREISANAQAYGALGRQTAASPDGSCFFTVQPPALAPDGRPWPAARYLVAFPVAHPMGGGGFWVTRFRREALRPGQQVRLLETGNYWNALRRHAELVVIDSPSADHSAAARSLAALVDTTVLVYAEDRGDPAASAQLKSALIEAGGRCAGVFLNRAGEDSGARRSRGG